MLHPGERPFQLALLGAVRARGEFRLAGPDLGQDQGGVAEFGRQAIAQAAGEMQFRLGGHRPNPL